MKNRMRYLVGLLNEASKDYYSSDSNEPVLTDKQYDILYKELQDLETNTGIRLKDSPTNRVGFAESEASKPLDHDEPILSIDSTKSINEIFDFIKSEEAVVSYKLDGMSVVLYYDNGYLEIALSRGNGLKGKDITANILKIGGVPDEISYKGKLVVRGEGVCSEGAFTKIKECPDGSSYKNPRNLSAGLINSLRPNESFLRKLDFVAHDIIGIKTDSDIFAPWSHTYTDCLDFLVGQGFNVVEHLKVDYKTLSDTVKDFSESVSAFEYPCDGLVIRLNDLDLCEKLGSTARSPRFVMALKWPDESKETVVTKMEWSVSQTGYVTPIVHFTPVELEGTLVSKANLHSLKCFIDLGIGIGDKLRVYKANKIVPEVEENLTRSKTERIPKTCPVCGGGLGVIDTKSSKILKCVRCERRERR
jgi:DNA ligase (NAD+)